LEEQESILGLANDFSEAVEESKDSFNILGTRQAVNSVTERRVVFTYRDVDQTLVLWGKSLVKAAEGN
jgi:hypothetical protein